jgi:hydroxymethylglutaryl-CoA reductase
MSLHARNIALAAGAIPEELADVVARLIKDEVVRQDHAEQVLAELRKADTGQRPAATS